MSGSGVGVVVVTRDRRESLLRTLAKIRSLPEQPPVVVVDNASRDGTPEAVRRAHPEVRLVRLAHNHGGAARTAGVRALQTDAVAFSDDDSWWAPGALAYARRLLDSHPRLGLIAARVLVGPRDRLDPTCAEMARSPLAPTPGLPGPRVLGFLACGAIVRRGAYLEVGGFEPRLGIGGEEQLLALDLAVAGWQLVYVADVVAHHHPSQADGGREARRDTELRNGLWSAWLRRSAPSAVACTVALTAEGLRAGQLRALVDAARGLPWALRRRRRLPADVERAARLLT